MNMRVFYLGLILFCLLIGSTLNSGSFLEDDIINEIDSSDPDVGSSGTTRGTRQQLETEPNDSFITANEVIIQGGMTSATYSGGFTLVNDVDYYKLSLSNGEAGGGLFASNVTIELDNYAAEPISHPIYMEFFDPDMHFLGKSEASMVLQTFHFIAPSNGYFYFVVYPTFFPTMGKYNITFRNESFIDLNPYFDTNNNFTKAWGIPDILTKVSRNESALDWFFDSYDFWKFKGMRGMNLTVELTMDNSADFDLFLYDAETNIVFANSNRTGLGTAEKIYVDDLPFDTTYYARVVVRRWPQAFPSTGKYNISIYGSMRPVWNESMSKNVYLQEDSGVFYRGLNNLFIEYNQQALDFKIWNASASNFDTHFDTNMMSVSVIQNVSLEDALQIKLKPDKFGVEQVEFKVEDTDGLSLFWRNNVTVFEVNDKPKINALDSWQITGGTAGSGPDKIVGTEDTAVDFTVGVTDIDLSNPDPWTDNITFEATLHDKGTTDLTDLPFTIHQYDGTVSYTPTNDVVGSFVVNFTVTDHPYQQSNTTDSKNVEFVVNNDNDGPAMKIVENLYVDEDSWLYYTFTASDIDKDDVLTFETNFTDDMVSGQFKFNTSGKLSFLPDNDDVGRHYLNVTVKDKGNLKDSIDLRIKVNNTNDPPVAVITSPIDDTLIEAEIDLVTLNASDSYDDDIKHGDKLFYSWYSSIQGDLGTGKTKDITLEEVGDHIITLTVKDREDVADTATVLVSVFEDIIPGTIEKPTINLSSPKNGDTINTMEVDLIWTTSFTKVLELKYDIYLWKDGEPEKRYQSDHTALTIHVTDLEDKTTYNWKVIPKYKTLEGVCWNGPWKFTVDKTFIPIYGVNLEFSDTITMEPDETETYVLKVHNTGNIGDEYEVNIKTDSSLLKASFEPDVITRTVSINKQDSISISFILTTDIDIEPGQYTITIDIESLKNSIAAQTRDFPATVEEKIIDEPTTEPDEKEGEEGNSLLIGIVIIVIIILIIVFFLIYRKRKAKPEEGVPGVLDVAIPPPAPYGMQMPQQMPPEGLPPPAVPQPFPPQEQVPPEQVPPEQVPPEQVPPQQWPPELPPDQQMAPVGVEPQQIEQPAAPQAPFPPPSAQPVQPTAPPEVPPFEAAAQAPAPAPLPAAPTAPAPPDAAGAPETPEPAPAQVPEPAEAAPPEQKPAEKAKEE
jgi:hypothetical protein